MNFLRRHTAALGAVIAVVVLASVVFTLARNSEKNHQAIEKGCVLLNNAIIRSSESANSPNSPSAALIAGIFTVIPPKYIEEYKRRSRHMTTVVPLINCSKVADHPEDIRAIQAKPVLP